MLTTLPTPSLLRNVSYVSFPGIKLSPRSGLDADERVVVPAQDMPSEWVEPEAAVQGSQAQGPPRRAGTRSRPPVPWEPHSHGGE